MDGALFEHEHFVALDYSVKSVSNSENGRLIELLVDQFLDPLLRNNINICCSFVKDHNFVFPQNRPDDTKKLSFACR